MIRILRFCTVLLFALAAAFAHADARVFDLNTPNPQTVVDALQARYGDSIQAELVQQRLVVIGERRKLEEVGALLAQLDPAPARLRLQLRAQPPAGDPGVITYSSSTDGYTIDTVEGAFVGLRHETLAQQIGSDARGWVITIENEPVEISDLTLQITLRDKRSALIVVSYTREENGRRRVFGNTVAGELGSWIALLPETSVAQQQQASTPHGGGTVTISSGAKRGSQLYLRIDKIFSQDAAPNNSAMKAR